MKSKAAAVTEKMQSFKAWRAAECSGYFRACIKEFAKKRPLEPQERPSLYKQFCAARRLRMHDLKWPDPERLAASYVRHAAAQLGEDEVDLKRVQESTGT